MFILAHFLSSLALLFSLVFKMLYFLLVVRIVMSWLRPDPYNEIVRTVYRLTDPLLLPLSRLPLQAGGIDFSPVLAFLLLTFLDSFIVGALKEAAMRFAG